jgi:hypothetical protein
MLDGTGWDRMSRYIAVQNFFLLSYEETVFILQIIQWEKSVLMGCNFYRKK